MPALTIGQMARQAGVGIDTVRFYERQGLLAEPRRSASERCPLLEALLGAPERQERLETAR